MTEGKKVSGYRATVEVLVLAGSPREARDRLGAVLSDGVHGTMGDEPFIGDWMLSEEVREAPCTAEDLEPEAYFNAGDPARGRGVLDRVLRAVKSAGLAEDEAWAPVVIETCAALRGEHGHEGVVRALGTVESMIVDGMMGSHEPWRMLLEAVREEMKALKALEAA